MKELIDLKSHMEQMSALPNRSQRREAIKKLTFAEVSRLIMYLRQAVIDKVENNVSATYFGKTVFLIGQTGAGKSTTLCYLRGDEMFLDDSFRYHSKSDSQDTIGHSGLESQTLLPNIEMIKDVAVVDFGGFQDTNGLLLCLGMEFALKNLINTCNPKILAIESIKNAENRFSGAEQRSLELSRLIKNKDDVCLLGITKYPLDSDYREIIKIKKTQNKKLALLNHKEQVLTLKLSDLNRFKSMDEPQRNEEATSSNPYYQNLLKLTEQQLLALEKKLYKKLQEIQQKQQKEPVKSLKKLDAHLQRLKQTEELLSSTIGLTKIIKFTDLTSVENRTACLEALSTPNQHKPHINPEQTLNSDDERLLIEIFNDSVIKTMYDPSNSPEKIKTFADFESLEQEITQYSLIHAVLSPEIGAFLHLPEMPPILAKQLDRQLIQSGIEKYIDAIAALQTTATQKYLNNLTPTPQTIELQSHLTRLENYVKGVTGKKDNEWIACQEKNKSNQPIEDCFKLPNWVDTLSFIPTIIPNTLYSIHNNPQPISNQTLAQCAVEADKLLNTLYELVKIKKAVSPKEKQNDKEYPLPFLATNSGFDKYIAKIITEGAFQEKQNTLWTTLSTHNSLKQYADLYMGLETVLEKAQDLYDRGYMDEADKAQQLVNNIVNAFNEHLMDSTEANNVQLFKQVCNDYVVDAQNTLAIHRGINHILANVALAIAGIGIFYAAACVMNKVKTGNWFFFQETDSVKKIEPLAASISTINPN